VESLKAQYRKGGLGDMALKRRLDEILQTLLKPVREKRAAVTDKEALEIAIEGTKKMKVRAKETMEAVRSAVGIVYRAG
jgi:tryptophanyl-tRNA synthetase